jgi:hypothetical protein
MPYISTFIPEPSAEFLAAAARPLATFSFDFGVMTFYWWTVEQSVLVRCSDSNGRNEWFLQPDGSIRRSIADLLDDDYYLKLKELMIFTSLEYKHGIAAPQRLRDDFFRCEWSDYACDLRVISGAVELRESKKVEEETEPMKITVNVNKGERYISLV